MADGSPFQNTVNYYTLHITKSKYARNDNLQNRFCHVFVIMDNLGEPVHRVTYPTVIETFRL